MVRARAFCAGVRSFILLATFEHSNVGTFGAGAFVRAGSNKIQTRICNIKRKKGCARRKFSFELIASEPTNQRMNLPKAPGRPTDRLDAPSVMRTQLVFVCAVALKLNSFLSFGRRVLCLRLLAAFSAQFATRAFHSLTASF